jgi:hypothetical protein
LLRGSRRFMRMLARAMLWAIKAMLLAVAVGTLLAWPFSHTDGTAIGGWVRDAGGRGLWLSRWTVGAEREERHRFMAWCQEGRIYLAESWLRLRVEGTARGEHSYDVSDFPGWRFDLGWHWGQVVPGRRWGPFRWALDDMGREGMAGSERALSVPCWLVALTGGAWPLTSLGLWAGRRVSARRAGRPGYCRYCGYDLRATPSPIGAQLPVCPECGRPSIAANMA